MKVWRRFVSFGAVLCAGLAFLLFLTAAALPAAPAQSRRPAILVLMHKAVDGPPAPDARMRHFCLPDPKLLAKFRALGFRIGVAPYASGLTMDFLKQFNVVVVLHPIIPKQFPGLADMARAKERLILDYVKAGGGLLALRAAAWQFGKDIDELNRWLKPLDVQALSEQVVDESNQVRLESGYKLSWTNNIARHPTTEGVRGLFYTTYFHMYTDSTSPVKTGPEWTVVVRGMKTAKSLRTIKGSHPPPPAPGSYASSPPLLAVRAYGAGRVAVWPINATCVWQDGYHVLWGRGLTMEGQSHGMRGDAARLLCNLVSWLAEPSRGRFGGYQPTPAGRKAAEAGFRRINWDRARLTGAHCPRCFKGLIGLKSSLSTGQAPPEEMIRAAQRAGYDFVGFAEDLDKLTQAEFERLQQTCKQHSSSKFRAYPGFTYLDESGNKWVTFSDRLHWPEKGWWSRKHPGRIGSNNPLSRGCAWPPVILVQSHRNPEKPWFQGNFKVLALYTYEADKLIDESVDVYRTLQRMRFQLAPAAVHFARSPAEVLAASRAGYQTYVRWMDEDVVAALSGHYCRYKDRYVFVRSAFVSEGPILEDCRILNFGTSDLAIPGNDRWRLHVRVRGDAGLREVQILDGDRAEPWRRFLLAGKKVFDIQIDGFHDRQRELIVRAVDARGRGAWGWTAWTSVQENQFPRCSDNINTMPRGKWWGEPKQMMNVRGIENYLCARGFRYMGLPTWAGADESLRPAVQYSPVLACRFGTILDCIIRDHYPKTAPGNPDRNDMPERAVPNEYVEGVVRHTLFTPWQDGPLPVLVEGRFTVKKAFTLRRAEVCRFGARKGADCFCAKRTNACAFAGQFGGRFSYYFGELPRYGFAAVFPHAFKGSVGFIPLQDGLIVHAFRSGPYAHLRGLLWRGERRLQPGDRLAYRYLAVTSRLDPTPDTRFITDFIDQLGLRGKTAYRVEPHIGSVTDTRYILRLRAQDYAFEGRFSHADLPLHLPTVIKGLNPRWPAAVWYPGRRTFTIAEWVVNEMNQRFAVRRRRVERDALRRFPVLPNGEGFLQVDTSGAAGRVFIGNLLVADQPNVRLEMTDWRKGKAAFVAHNPTDQPITCTVRPAPGFALLGAFRKRVTVPAGASVRVSL